MKLPQVFDLYLDCKTEEELILYYNYLVEEKKRFEAKIKLAQKLAKEYKVRLK